MLSPEGGPTTACWCRRCAPCATIPLSALSLVLTGQHLVRDAGDTAARVREDGFTVAATVDMELAATMPVSVTEAAGRGLSSNGERILEALARHRPVTGRPL